MREGFDRDPATFAELRTVLESLFPALAGVTITHEWGGPLGVPRDWYSSVGFEKTTGLAWAGGYVGDGVGTSNLAGRTLADLILGLDTELTAPGVGRAPLAAVGAGAVALARHQRAGSTSPPASTGPKPAPVVDPAGASRSCARVFRG